MNTGVAVIQFGATVATVLPTGCGISKCTRNGARFSFGTFEISERGFGAIGFQRALTLIEHAARDKGIRITVVFAIVHILRFVVRTDDLPIRTLDIPVDIAVFNAFPSWVVIFQTDLPAAVVLGVGVVTFTVTVQRSHHRNFHL